MVFFLVIAFLGGGRLGTWGCILLLERERGLRTKKFGEEVVVV